MEVKLRMNSRGKAKKILWQRDFPLQSVSMKGVQRTMALSDDSPVLPLKCSRQAGAELSSKALGEA